MRVMDIFRLLFLIQLLFLPKTGRIGLTTTTNSNVISTLSAGRKLSGVNGNSGSAIIVGSGSSVKYCFRNNKMPVKIIQQVLQMKLSILFNIVSRGQNLKLLITTDANGTITGAASSSTSYGNGYQVGDVVGIVTSSTSTTTGRDARITIGAITGLDTLYLTNVQGEFGINGSGKEFAVGAAVSYFNNSGTFSFFSRNNYY